VLLHAAAAAKEKRLHATNIHACNFIITLTPGLVYIYNMSTCMHAGILLPMQ